MAFLAKTDYFGLTAALSGLVVTSNSDGASQSNVEATDEKGSIIANTTFGYTCAPSNSYVVKSTVTATAGAVKLGNVTTTDRGELAPIYACLNSLAINTSSGGAPTVTASGEGVENSNTGCKYSVPAFTLPVTHHAAILFGAFTLSGTGCYLNSANYTITATVTKAEKDGTCLAHDVSGAKIEAQITIIQTGSAMPEITAGTEFEIIAPLACDNPDSNYPTWQATLVSYLTKD